MSETLSIPSWAQGRAGLGQGGYACAMFEAAIGLPVSISLRGPIPLETEMVIISLDEGWELRHDDRVVMSASPRSIDFASTTPVTIAEAAAARERFPVTAHDHNAPHCLSCGFGERTMRIWPGLLDDHAHGDRRTIRVATDWVPPTWAGDDDGFVNEALVWMALDCTSAFFVGQHPEPRQALTVQYAVDVMEPVRVGESYAVVGFDGNWPGGWDGRKRGAGSCVFASDGRQIARSDSFWVSIPDPL
jgi:hypothetical protein